MDRFTKEWARDTAERVITTFLEAFAASVALALTAAPKADLSTWESIGYSAAVAGLAAAASTIKAICAAFRTSATTPAGLVNLNP